MGFDGNEILENEKRRIANELKLEAEAKRQQKAMEEAEREKRAAEINKELKPIVKAEAQKMKYQVDCHACRLEGGMAPAKIHRFTGLVLIAGWIIALPACLGILAAIMVWFTGYDQGFQFFLRVGVSLGVFCFSCVMGTVGWLLISKRSVFLCRRCGYVMDRTTE